MSQRKYQPARGDGVMEEAMEIRMRITCPYCHRELDYVKVEASVYFSAKQIINCDSEQGGCDRYFAAFVSLRPYVSTFELTDPKTEAQ